MSSVPSTKIIVTNVGALRRKYGARAQAVLAAVRQLAAADAKRGLTTTLVDLGSTTALKRFKGRPVTKQTDERATKAAVDAIFHAREPDYLVILGAGDVVVQQTLDNPVPTDGADGDPDKTVPSDLPYACEAAYSRDPAAFRAPTRVVGRIPDLVAAKDPQYLVDVLALAAKAQTGQAAAYASGFGVSAAVWKGSTALSVRNLFGRDADLQLVPPKGPNWPASLLHRRPHFINCHGADADSHFYGQRGNDYPVSFDAAKMPQNGLDGVVVAAECCYGGQMYDPALSNGQPNVASTYLRAGAYAFFGSSTVAYGPATGNGSADLICQYFLHAAITGASTGRAALEARQRFVQQSANLDPTDLKTLAQYVLLGDPSIEPVQPAHTLDIEGVATDRARSLRRDALAKYGVAIASATGVARRAPRVRPSAKVLAAIRTALAGGGRETALASYVVEEPAAKGVRGMKAPASREKKTVHVAIRRASDVPDKHVRLTVVVATEVAGQIAKIRRLYSR